MFSMHVQTAAMDSVFVEVVIALQAKRCGTQKKTVQAAAKLYNSPYSGQARGSVCMMRGKAYVVMLQYNGSYDIRTSST